MCRVKGHVVKEEAETVKDLVAGSLAVYLYMSQAASFDLHPLGGRKMSSQKGSRGCYECVSFG